MAGWPSGQLIAPAGELGDPIKVRDPEDLIANVQKEHPALKTKEAQVELGEARAKSARRDRLPEPWIGVYFGREREPNTAPNIPGSKIVLGMVTIPLPFFKRNQLARAQTKAELSVAQTELEVVRYQLALNARRAVDAINTAAERVQTYSREVVPRFEENLQLLQRAFELGEVDIIEVFVAREISCGSRPRRSTPTAPTSTPCTRSRRSSARRRLPSPRPARPARPPRRPPPADAPAVLADSHTPAALPVPRNSYPGDHRERAPERAACPQPAAQERNLSCDGCARAAGSSLREAAQRPAPRDSFYPTQHLSFGADCLCTASARRSAGPRPFAGVTRSTLGFRREDLSFGPAKDPAARRRARPAWRSSAVTSPRPCC
nr:TolC family protein [Nannocystis pusilla]